MNINLISSLQLNFGFASFRVGQLEALESLLSGNHTLVVMPTGSGKSLIYQLAALQMPGITLVISPLIALMKDQVDSLERRCIPAIFINSNLSGIEQKHRLDDLAAGKYKLVYVAPERLRSISFLKALQKQTVSLLAVDEAHCISEWGHDFRPDYLHIVTFRQALGNPLTVALTATATPQVQEDISRLLGLLNSKRIVTGFNRPNISFEVRYARDIQSRMHELLKLFTDQKDNSAIIYTGTRRDAEELADFVNKVVGIRAHYYHAGLSPEERSHIQDDFISGDIPVVVATNAFGMGIDRPDVRQVIHYSIPGSLEAYYQESGRAGRDGLIARAVLLYSPEDRALQEWFIENSTLTIEDLRLLFNALQPIGVSQAPFTNDDISCLTGLPEVKIRLGLAELERAGTIEHLGDYGPRMRIKIHTWKEPEILAAIHRLAQHKKYRKKQLQRMIAYAESNNCRRKILLKHFGDSGFVEADICCDNCQSRRSLQQSASAKSSLIKTEQPAMIVLDTVRRMKNPIGREKVIQILRGSRAKDIIKFGYDKNANYGKLVIISSDHIKEIIDQLLEKKYLKVIGGKYPVLCLTPLGEEVILNMVSLPEKSLFKATSDDGITKSTDSKSSEKKYPSGYLSLEQIVSLGNAKTISAVPELVNCLKSADGNMRRLAASALGKIASKKSTKSLIELLSTERKPQVRQYAVVALGKIGSVEAKQLLESIVQNSKEKDYTHEAARIALRKLSVTSVDSNNTKQSHPNDELIVDFLSHSHPRQLPGPWKVGWALGFHSQFFGSNWNRSEVGELAHRLKYEEDLNVLPALVDHAMDLIAGQPDLKNVDALIPVPPSKLRSNDPVSSFTKALAKQLDIEFSPILIKSRQTLPQKEMHTLAQKHANVAQAFKFQSSVKGMRLLIVDDLFDSGATLEEIYHLLHNAGAAQVSVLTLTRTIHSDA